MFILHCQSFPLSKLGFHETGSFQKGSQDITPVEKLSREGSRGEIFFYFEDLSGIKSSPLPPAPAARAGEELIRFKSSAPWKVQKSRLCYEKYAKFRRSPPPAPVAADAAIFQELLAQSSLNENRGI